MSNFKRLGVIAGAIAFLVSGGSVGLAAGFGKILGTIKNEQGLPLSGADISALAVKAPAKLVTVQTDSHGKFRIEKLPPGEYAIRISQKGYQPVTRPPVRVAPGHSTALNLILHLAEFVTSDPNPNNWDIRTALKASQDRRLIFRDRDGVGDGAEWEGSGSTELLKNSAVRVSSSLGDPYSDRRMSKPSLSFAYAPLTSLNGKYTVAGQWNPVDSSAWRIKNSLDFRLSERQTLRLSTGFGKTGQFATNAVRRPQASPEGHGGEFSLVQTFDVTAESRTRLSDYLTIAYGIGYDQVRSFETRTYAHPEIDVMLAPRPNWLVRGRITSRRDTVASTLWLPDGEAVQLNEPLSLVQAGRQVLISGTQHYEVALSRRMPDRSELSISTYADRSIDRMPVITNVMRANGQIRPRLFQLNDRQADSDGVRIAFSKQLCDALSGSVAYVYATGVEAQKDAAPIPLSREYLMDLNRRGSFHLISARVEAGISKTRTHITTVLKWMPRKPINTLDQYSDTWDVANGGVNLFIRQSLPLPLFLNLLSGWEAAVDMRNLLDQNNGSLATSSKDTIVLKNPRSFRGGILFRF